jgi:hypothetical protein
MQRRGLHVYVRFVSIRGLRRSYVIVSKLSGTEEHATKMSQEGWNLLVHRDTNVLCKQRNYSITVKLGKSAQCVNVFEKWGFSTSQLKSFLQR